MFIIRPYRPSTTIELLLTRAPPFSLVKLKLNAKRRKAAKIVT